MRRCPTETNGRVRWALVVLVCVLVPVGSGCRKRTVHAAPPVLVTSPTAAGPAEAKPEPTKPEPKPATAPEPGNPAPKPVVPVSKPAPLKGASSPKSPTVTEPAPAPRPAAPQISPRLSPEQQADYQRRTEEAIFTSEKNLQRAYGRKLNSAQLDMVEKIRGFLAQSREAMRSGDWARAHNLAEKALVLSNELVGSL